METAVMIFLGLLACGIGILIGGVLVWFACIALWVAALPLMLVGILPGIWWHFD